MTTVNIHLPDALKTYLESQAARRGYKGASEFVQALLEAERHRDLGKELERALLEAADGPLSEFTTDDVADIERAGDRVLAKRRLAR